MNLAREHSKRQLLNSQTHERSKQLGKFELGTNFSCLHSLMYISFPSFYELAFARSKPVLVFFQLIYLYFQFRSEPVPAQYCVHNIVF